MNKKINVAVVGATGTVGRMMLKVLEERNFPIANLILLASKKSVGTLIKFKDKEYEVKELDENSFSNGNIELALFSVGGSISEKYAPIAAQNGVIVVDNSSRWRMEKNIPLILPEVNINDYKKYNSKIIANPNCSTIQTALPLKALNEKYGLKRIVYSTYQAVSGSGVKRIEDLKNGIEGKNNQFYPYPIFSNCLPHIDDFIENGYTKEEEKMINETRKILGLPDLKVTATTVRVPVFNCHSVSVNIEFYKSFEIDDLLGTLKEVENLVIVDDISEKIYPTIIDADGKDEVFVGRIRRDFSVDNGINYWIVADNVRKGAATNAVQIAEKIFELK